MSVAAISFVYFTEEGTRVTLPWLDQPLDEQFAPMLFTTLVSYLMVSFSFAVIDDVLNSDDPRFIGKTIERRRDHIDPKLEALKKEVALIFREDLKNKITNVQNDLFCYPSINDVRSVSKGNLESVATLMAKLIIEHQYDALFNLRVSEASHITDLEAGRLTKEIERGGVELDLHILKRIYSDVYSHHKNAFVGLLDIDKRELKTSLLYTLFRTIRSTALEIITPFLAGLFALVATITN